MNLIKKVAHNIKLLILICFVPLTIFGQPTNCELARKKYLERYSDVKSAHVDPWNHFTNFGKREGRIWPYCDGTFSDNYPNCNLSRVAYLMRYSGIRKQQIDAFEHYNSKGKFIGMIWPNCKGEFSDKHPNPSIQQIESIQTELVEAGYYIGNEGNNKNGVNGKLNNYTISALLKQNEKVNAIDYNASHGYPNPKGLNLELVQKTNPLNTLNTTYPAQNIEIQNTNHRNYLKRKYSFFKTFDTRAPQYLKFNLFAEEIDSSYLREVQILENEINNLDSFEDRINQFKRYSQKHDHKYFKYNQIDTGLANLFIFYQNKVIFYLERGKWGRFKKKLAKLNLRNTGFGNDNYKIYFAYDTITKIYINLPLLDFNDVLAIEKLQKNDIESTSRNKLPPPDLYNLLIGSENSKFGEWHYTEDYNLFLNKKFSIFLKKHPEIFQIVPESSKKSLLQNLTNIDDPIIFKEEFNKQSEIKRKIEEIRGKTHKLNEETFFYGNQKLKGIGIVKNKKSGKTLWVAYWENGVPVKMIHFNFNIPQNYFLLHNDSVMFSVNNKGEIYYSISQFKTKNEGSNILFTINGYGIYENSRLKYIGNYNNGKKEGYGIEIQFENRKINQIYEGNWQNNTQNGKGILLSQYGNTKEWAYAGEFTDGHFNGIGIISFRDSSRENQTGLFAHDKLIKTNYQLAYEQSQRDAERRQQSLVTSGNYDKQIDEIYRELFSESMASDFLKVNYDIDKKLIEKTKAFEDNILGRNMSEDEQNYFNQFILNQANKATKGLKLMSQLENAKTKAKTKPSKTACQCKWCGSLFPNYYDYLKGDYVCELYCPFEKCKLERKKNGIRM